MDQGERPKFRNVEPRSRQERLANNDKEMLEKLRLEHRRGGAYRYDNPGNIIQPPEDSAAFISEGERFGTNAAQEEYENRRRRILEREVRAVVNPRITDTRASTAAAARERPPSIVGRDADPTCHESRKTAPLFWVPAMESFRFRAPPVRPRRETPPQRPFRPFTDPQEYFERKREANHQRETARWHKVDLEGQWEDEHLAELKEGPVPTRNKSSVRYNFITLQYEDSYEGEALKYQDDIVKRNAALRAGKINHMRMAETRTDYDVITGLPKPKVRVPVPELGPEPVAPEKVEREKPEAYRVDMQYGVGDAAVRETHEKEDWKFGGRGGNTWGR